MISGRRKDGECGDRVLTRGERSEGARPRARRASEKGAWGEMALQREYTGMSWIVVVDDDATAHAGFRMYSRRYCILTGEWLEAYRLAEATIDGAGGQLQFSFYYLLSFSTSMNICRSKLL